MSRPEIQCSYLRQLLDTEPAMLDSIERNIVRDIQMLIMEIDDNETEINNLASQLSRVAQLYADLAVESGRLREKLNDLWERGEDNRIERDLNS